MSRERRFLLIMLALLFALSLLAVTVMWIESLEPLEVGAQEPTPTIPVPPWVECPPYPGAYPVEIPAECEFDYIPAIMIEPLPTPTPQLPPPGPDDEN